MIKNDLVKAIQSFFHFGFMLEYLNHPIISLIPKLDRPFNLTHYRPITLYNILYKIMSKVLVNRLKMVLDTCISKNQAAFAPRRQILDNVMISHEYMHYLKNKRQGLDGFMALKLDMSKAYDRMEWSFLETIVRKMRFAESWIR